MDNPNKDGKAYLLLMRDSFAKIANYVAGMSYESFVADGKTQSAVIMQLQVVGELSKKIQESIKSVIDLPWKQMAGFRNVVAHDYFSIDLPTVWYTVTESVPEAETKVKEYLASLIKS